MRFIPESEVELLRAHLEKKLEGPVTLDLFIEPKPVILVPGRQECELCEETRALLEDVASLSNQITLTVHDARTETDLAREMGVSRVPTLVVRGAARGVVRYLGIPAGLEFGTLLEDLAAVSGGTTSLRDETRTKLATLTKPVHVQVFVTPTCPYCPKVASLAHQAAVENANVTADVIEISEFPDLAAQYQVRGVPKVVISRRRHSWMRCSRPPPDGEGSTDTAQIRRYTMTSFKPFSIFGAVALLVVGGVSVALAQTTSTGPQASPMYDVKTETTIKGTVESVETVTGTHGRGHQSPGGTHLVVKTEKEALEVHVGPTAYLTEKGITLAKGDTVEILGSRVTIGDEPVLIAKQIKKGDNTWTLRDASGRPLWSGRGRSGANQVMRPPTGRCPCCARTI